MAGSQKIGKGPEAEPLREMPAPIAFAETKMPFADAKLVIARALLLATDPSVGLEIQEKTVILRTTGLFDGVPTSPADIEKAWGMYSKSEIEELEKSARAKLMAHPKGPELLPKIGEALGIYNEGIVKGEDKLTLEYFEEVRAMDNPKPETKEQKEPQRDSVEAALVTEPEKALSGKEQLLKFIEDGELGWDGLWLLSDIATYAWVHYRIKANDPEETIVARAQQAILVRNMGIRGTRGHYKAREVFAILYAYETDDRVKDDPYGTNCPGQIMLDDLHEEMGKRNLKPVNSFS
jgi:hypothetical protein